MFDCYITEEKNKSKAKEEIKICLQTFVNEFEELDSVPIFLLLWPKTLRIQRFLEIIFFICLKLEQIIYVFIYIILRLYLYLETLFD